MTLLHDRQEREQAATVSDRNIVVTAGAGTGKTTLLVDRMAALLLRRADPLSIGQIVALTFTNKAANELKLRLRDRLRAFLGFVPDRPPELATRRREWDQMKELSMRYDLSKARLDELAEKALQELETSQIGTIHSFAAHVLRLYPIDGLVDPTFQEDDGQCFNQHFNHEWTLWLREELGPEGSHHDIWRTILPILSLEDLRELAVALAGELNPLHQLPIHSGGSDLPAALQEWARGIGETCHALLEDRAQTTTLERVVAAVASVLQQSLDQGLQPDVRNWPESLTRGIPKRSSSWSVEDYEQAKRCIRIAQAITTADQHVLVPVLQLLVPFVNDCRIRFVQKGYITFDGLLARARDLLRDNVTIRQELKKQFRALLVDEFQDTDPVQYELILYLAESIENKSKDWRTVRLEPGKLFIVGDPKQSIYAFRGADMEAYDTVVKDRIIGQTPAAESYTLQTNFRSHRKLLATLNAFFSKVFPEEPIRGVQPRHEPLQAFEDDSSPLPSERVELRLVRPSETETDIDAATRMEAEELARWLSEEVFGRQEILDLGARVKVKPKHVAILLRTFTKARDYLEALRRHDIPCLADGEKHFYERQEIIDVVHVMRVVANPLDRVALVGVLRSAIGGVPDTDLEALVRANLLDYRYEKADLEHSRQVPSTERAAPVYAVLRELHRLMPRLPLDDAIHLLFARLPLLELAAASIDHEQAVANLMKLRNILSRLAQQGDLSFQGLVTEMMRRVSEPPDEPECSLVEETLEETEQIGAVRLLSVHKAKGLEFPVVILAGLHQRSGRSDPRIMAQHDWSSGLVGVRVGELQTVGGIYVRDKLAVRQRAERKRILYVAMTRAKRRLILSAGLPGAKSRSEESALALISSVLGIDPFATEQATIPVGEGEVMIDVMTTPDRRRSVPGEVATWREVADDPRELQKRWSDRSKRWEDAAHTVLYATPSELSAPHRTRSRDTPLRSRPHADWDGRAMAGLIGTLAHRVLEGWDYAEEPEGLQERVASICHHAVPPEWAQHADRIQRELCEILRAFSVSAPYAELRRATVIHREMPFVMPWNGSISGSSISPREGCAIEGVIDIVYRINGKVWIADYKTDLVSDEEVHQRAATYEPQARVYKAAVARGLGLEHVYFQFLFLRNGVAIPV